MYCCWGSNGQEGVGNSLTGVILLYLCVCPKPGFTSGAVTADVFEALEFNPSFSWAHVAQSLVFCVLFVDHCLSFCPFSFNYCDYRDIRLLITPLES